MTVRRDLAVAGGLTVSEASSFNGLTAAGSATFNGGLTASSGTVGMLETTLFDVKAEGGGWLRVHGAGDDPAVLNGAVVTTLDEYGNVVASGTVTAANATVSGAVTAASAAISGDGSFGGDVVIAGSLTINGTTTSWAERKRDTFGVDIPSPLHETPA